MKTPMQEVFDNLRASKDSNGFGEAYCVDWLLEMEESMLEKQINQQRELLLAFADYSDYRSGRRQGSSRYMIDDFLKTKER